MYLKYNSPRNSSRPLKTGLAAKKNPEQSTGLGLGEFVALRLLGRAARCRGMGEPPGRPIKQKYASDPGRCKHASRHTVNACRRRSNLTMADWDTLLTFIITPKSGPLRKMVTLHDCQQAIIADLPPGLLRRAHWLKAGKALVTAAETAKPKDIEWVFESIVAALDEEGWLPQGASRVPPRSDLPRFDLPRFDPPHFESLRRVRPSVSNVTPRRPPEPLWWHTRPNSDRPV